MKSTPKKTLRHILICALATCAVGSSAFAEHVRVTNPNALSFELGGRSILYTVAFDRVLSDELAVGIGYGGGATGNTIPVYLNYYFAREAGSLYLTAGANLLTNSNLTGGNLNFTSSFMGVAGLGYEYRSDPGFLVRVAGYALLGTPNIAPWGGFTVGYSF